MRLTHRSWQTLKILRDQGILIPTIENDSIFLCRYSPADVATFLYEYISIKDAAKIIGYTENWTREKARSGKIPFIFCPEDKGISSYLFKREAINQWKMNHLTTRETIALLGITRNQLGTLMRNRIIAPIKELGANPYWFDLESVNSIKPTLSNHLSFNVK